MRPIPAPRIGESHGLLRAISQRERIRLDEFVTEICKRYVRAGDDADPFTVSPAQADWLRRQLLEKHMTDSIYHGLAIGLSPLSSVPPATRISILDFGRSLGYLGRAGWDNDNTLQIQGERY